MGNGLPPSPANDLGAPMVIDHGTSARTESPPPGPIGLDAKSGAPKQSQASMADQIVAYPRQRQGQRVGDGECFTLTDRALRNAGARTAGDFGQVTPNADYVWGTSVTLADLRPGDVIQFRDYRFTKHVVIERSNETVTQDEDGDRPHHTAIVESVGANGAVTVLEQNAPEGSGVGRHELYFRGGTTTSGNTTTTITVSGTFWFYRPQAR
jgi:hypothetical protein